MARSRRPPQGAATLGDRVASLPQYLLPHHPLSRTMHCVARVRARPLKNALIRWFIRRYGVDMSAAQLPRPDDYAHFNDFFTRALRPGVRPVATMPHAVACPVDGAVSQAGVVRAGELLQAKGRRFDLVRLLGGSAARAAPFRDGHFATLYLSPRDYHRIHAPLAATLRETVRVPGRLYSVQPRTARAIPGLFARNERVAALFDSAAGPLAVVMVGAIFVASVETVWDGVVTPVGKLSARRHDGPPLRLARGQELGRFNMGSTVILLFAKDRVRWHETLRPGAAVRMGQVIGSLQGLSRK